MSNIKPISVIVGNFIVPVTIFKSNKPIAIFYESSIPNLVLPENWTREDIRKHIKKYIK